MAVSVQPRLQERREVRVERAYKALQQTSQTLALHGYLALHSYLALQAISLRRFGDQTHHHASLLTVEEVDAVNIRQLQPSSS